MAVMACASALAAAGLYRAVVAGYRRVLAYRASGAAGLAAVDGESEARTASAEHACSLTA